MGGPNQGGKFCSKKIIVLGTQVSVPGFKTISIPLYPTTANKNILQNLNPRVQVPLLIPRTVWMDATEQHGCVVPPNYSLATDPV